MRLTMKSVLLGLLTLLLGACGGMPLRGTGDLGLIDIADLRASGNPIPRHRRLRNLKHLMRDEQDRAWICHPDATVFDRAYNIALGQGAADRA